MKRAYDEVMEHIQVTEEMRTRILEQLQNTDRRPAARVIPFSALKKYGSIAAGFILLLVGAIDLPRLLNPTEPEPPVLTGPDIVEAASIQELSQLVGFEVRTDFSLPFQAEEITYCSYWNEMAQIEYSGGGCSAMYRQSLGTDDNSGDYNTYGDITVMEVNGLDITLKGENGIYTLALWTDGDCAYSFALSPGAKADSWRNTLTR